MSTTVKVSKSTKEKLVRVATKLQKRYGRRVNLDEAIRYLLKLEERKLNGQLTNPHFNT